MDDILPMMFVVMGQQCISDHITLKRKYHLANISPLVATKAVLFIISCATIDENITLIPSKCIWSTSQALFCAVMLYSTNIHIHTEAKLNMAVCIFYRNNTTLWYQIRNTHTYVFEIIANMI